MQAARIAAASLHDTLTAVGAARVRRRVVAVDQPEQFRAPRGFAVSGQGAGGLDERLAAVAVAIGGPVLLVGMDTPQLTADLVEHAATTLGTPGVDAVLGPADDGGYWALGLWSPRAEHVLGVPMSRADTGTAQRARLEQCGAGVATLPMLRDVDTFTDALAVAAMTPGSRFAGAVADVVRTQSVAS